MTLSTEPRLPAPRRVASPRARPTVLSIPAGHPFVRAWSDGLDVLPDPPVPGAPAGVWWPHQALDAAWLETHLDGVDAMVVHFGFEHLCPGAFRGVLAAVSVPIVAVVHDLENPQLADQTEHVQRLADLVRCADAVVTLTPGAAAEIERRWGRRATVLAHPTLLEAIEPRPGAAARRARPVVGVVRKNRANFDADVLGVLARAAAACGATWREQPAEQRLDDAALVAWIKELDVLVLPYRHGTHSGFLELAHDLGVQVLAADVGHLRDQHPEPTFLRTWRSPEEIEDELRALLATPRPPVDPGARLRQREESAAAFAEVVRGVLR